MTHYTCEICEDARWVCEQHLGPWRAANDDCGIEGGCAGPGMPCECNPLSKAGSGK